MHARPKILLVDDEPAVVENLSLYLSLNGFDTISAGDGKEALAKLTSEQPDVTVLDINMPKKGGVEVLEEMQRCSNRTPVIVMTAYGRDNDLDVIVLNWGAIYYLDKPFQNAQLLARINRALKLVPPPRVLDDLSPDDLSPDARPTLVWTSLRLDLGSKQAFWQEKRKRLQPLQFELLAYLMLNSRQLFTRIQLIHALRDEEYDPSVVTRCKAGICQKLPVLREIIEAYDGGYIFNAEVVRV